jgi:hypothetical protein
MAEPGTIIAAPMFSLREQDLVTLLVGPDEQKFIIHESCIARNSDFFKAALKKEWAEGQTRTVKLPDEHCLDTVVHYLNFAYHGKLPTQDIITNFPGGLCPDPYPSLAKIYVLGERMIDKAVQHAAIKEFIRLSSLKNKDNQRSFPGAQATTVLFEGTNANSPIRRLIVDFYVTYGTASWAYDSHHRELLSDLAKELQIKVHAQTTVRDFHNRTLVAEDYFN